MLMYIFLSETGLNVTCRAEERTFSFITYFLMIKNLQRSGVDESKIKKSIFNIFTQQRSHLSNRTKNIFSHYTTKPYSIFLLAVQYRKEIVFISFPA